MVDSLFFQQSLYSLINRWGYKTASFLNAPEANGKLYTMLPCFFCHIPLLDIVNTVSDDALVVFGDLLQGKLYSRGYLQYIHSSLCPNSIPDYKKTEINNFSAVFKTIAQGIIPIVTGLPWKSP